MTLPTRRSALVLSITALLTARQAASQVQVQPTAAQETATGDRLFAEGVFERAQQHYQKAYDLGHKPADLQKVGDCQRAAGDLGGAHDTYVKLLATHGAALGRSAAVVKKAIAETEDATGVLSVTSKPPGAAVRVGDRELGVTPLAGARLATGVVHVEVTKEGFEPYSGLVTIDPAHPATVDATLVQRAITGHLSVRELHGTAAHLLLDGQDVGALPWQGDVAAGSHELSIQAPLVQASPQTIKLRAGGSADVVFSALSTAGHIVIDARPATASIEVDGAFVGNGHYEADVAPGDHAVRISAPGYKADERHVKLEAQTTQSASIVLDRFVSPEEIARQKAEEEAAKYRGGYGQVALFGAAGVLTTHLTCDEIPTGAASTSCSPGFVYGGGLSVHAGYGFGLLGIEGTLLLTSAFWKDDVKYTMPSAMPGGSGATSMGVADITHQEEYTWMKLGGLIGAGPRITTPGENVRFTIGASGGLSIKGVFLSRSLSNGLAESPSYSDAALVLAPAATADLGLTIGSVPGASFSFGAMAWADFPSSTQITPGGKSVTEVPQNGASSFQSSVGPFTAESGPQIYFGPYFGIRFGR